MMTKYQVRQEIDGTIYNPDNINHFMVVKPVKHLVRVFHKDILIGETMNALRVIEMAKVVYDPALYIPAEDMVLELEQIVKSTHCPLKGKASYFLHNAEEISWCYDSPYDFARTLQCRFAFWQDRVRIVEGE